jgi:hypothetical protein
VTGQTLHTPESFPRSAGQGSNSTQSTPIKLTCRGVFASSERMVLSSYTTYSAIADFKESVGSLLLVGAALAFVLREGYEARSFREMLAQRAGAKLTGTNARS